MAAARCTLRHVIGFAVLAAALAQTEDRFRDRPILPAYETEERPLKEPVDYEQYDYDYYDDAQPRPPSRLDKILPQVTFQCRAEGYFADPQFDCEVFHYCSVSGERFTFLCGEGSKFHQKTLICDFDHNLRCGGDGTLERSPSASHADTLSAEHLFPAGEIMKTGAGQDTTRRAPPQDRPAAAPARPEWQPRPRPESTYPAVEPPLQARRRQDTLPTYPEDPEPAYTPPRSYQESPPRSYQDPPPRSYQDAPPRSYQDAPLRSYQDAPPRRSQDPVPTYPEEPAPRYPERREGPARPVPQELAAPGGGPPQDRYYATPPQSAQRRQSVPEDGYRAVLNDIHQVIRETEAFQLPVLPLLTPAQSRQDGPDPSTAEPPPRLHVPRDGPATRASRRRDPYGPTPLRRPGSRRRRSAVWEDDGLLALRDIVDSEVSRFFPRGSGSAEAERRSDVSLQQRESRFDEQFFSELDGFGDAEFGAPWPAPVSNEIPVGPATRQERRYGRVSSGSRHQSRRVTSDVFGYRRGRSEAEEEAPSEPEEDLPSAASVTERSDTEELPEDQSASATTEALDTAEYGTPKATSILSAAETAELAETAASTVEISRRRPRRQQLLQFSPPLRNEGVDQLRQLQRQQQVFAAPRPGQPFVNTQFVNVGPSPDRRPNVQDDQQDPQDRQGDFGNPQRLQPASPFTIQSPDPFQFQSAPAFGGAIAADSASTARQTGFRAIGGRPGEQSFIRQGNPQQFFPQPVQRFPPTDSFGRPVFQDSQRFGGAPSVVTVGNIPTSFGAAGPGFGLRPGPSTTFGPISTSSDEDFDSGRGSDADGSNDEEGDQNDGRPFVTSGPQPGSFQFGRPPPPQGPAGFQQQQQPFRGGLLPAPNALGFNTFVAPQFAAGIQRLPPPQNGQGRPFDNQPATGPARFIPQQNPSQRFPAQPLPTAAPFPFSARPAVGTTPRPQTATPSSAPPTARPQTTFPAFEQERDSFTAFDEERNTDFTGFDDGPTAFPTFDDQNGRAPRPRPLVVSLQPLDDDFFSGPPTGRPLVDEPQPFETTGAPAPHIFSPLPEGVLGELDSTTAPTAATEPPAPTTAAPLGQGRRRLRTGRPGGRRRRPTGAPEVTNELAPEDETPLKDSGFTVNEQAVTDAPEEATRGIGRRRRPGSRRRLTGRRRVRPSQQDTEEDSADNVEEEEPTTTTTTTAAPVRAFRRRRPTAAGGFRSRPRARESLRTRLRQKDSQEDTAEDSAADEPAAQEETVGTQQTAEDEQVAPTAGRRRRPAGLDGSDRSRRPLRRRNRVRLTEAPSEAEEETEAPEQPVTEAPSQAEQTADITSESPAEPEVTPAPEPAGEEAAKTTKQRLQELFERRRQNRLSFRREGASSRRRPVAETAAEEPAGAEQKEDNSEASSDVPARRTGSRRLTQSRLRLRVERPTAERGSGQVTVQRVTTADEPVQSADQQTETEPQKEQTQTETEKQTEQLSEKLTEQPEPEPEQQPEEPTERPGRRRFRGRQRTRLPPRAGGRVSTLASLLEKTDAPTTPRAPLPTAAAAPPTAAESLAAVNLESSNMESRGDPPKRTLFGGSLRHQRPSTAQVTRTTITPVLAETENPPPRATRPLRADQGDDHASAEMVTEPTVPAETGSETTTRTTTTETTVQTTVAETTAQPVTEAVTETTTQTTTEAVPQTTAQTTAEAVPETTAGTPTASTPAQTAEPAATEPAVTTVRAEFIPFDSTAPDVGLELDSIVEQVHATEASASHPSITMATDSPLLPLQSLFDRL